MKRQSPNTNERPQGKADIKWVASARQSNYMQIEIEPFPLVA